MKDDLRKALDEVPSGGGIVIASGPGATAEVDVVDVDRIGVRVRSVKVSRERAVDVTAEAERLPKDLRSLPDRIAPVEVAPSLGGARLRTRPEDYRESEYFEVEVQPKQTAIRRTKVVDGGAREASDWSMSREQLEKLIDEAKGPASG